jgi:hypothetical protein
MAAISCMSREWDISEISDLLFAFVRSMSSLCDTKADVKRENLALELE